MHSMKTSHFVIQFSQPVASNTNLQDYLKDGSDKVSASSAAASIPGSIVLGPRPTVLPFGKHLFSVSVHHIDQPHKLLFQSMLYSEADN